MSAKGFKCSDYPKGPQDSTRHCCYAPCTPDGRTIPDPRPCISECDGYVCDAHFAEIKRHYDFLDGRPVPAFAPPSQPTCARCGAPVRKPRRGATARYCGQKCRSAASWKRKRARMAVTTASA